MSAVIMATSAAIMASAAVHSSGSSEPMQPGTALLILIILALGVVPNVVFRKRIKAQAFDTADYYVSHLGVWAITEVALFCLLGVVALAGVAMGY